MKSYRWLSEDTISVVRAPWYVIMGLGFSDLLDVLYLHELSWRLFARMYEKVDQDRNYRYESYEDSMARLDYERAERAGLVKECEDD